MKFKIIKSRRRLRTASTRQKKDHFVLTVPYFLKKDQIEEIKNRFRKKIEKSQKRKNNLEKMADQLNQQYFKGKLKYGSADWSDQQKAIFGSCSMRNKRIRLSSCLKKAPVWVIKAVLLHELTHLVYPDHGRKFNRKMDEYPRLERAKGYLHALKQFEKELEN